MLILTEVSILSQDRLKNDDSKPNFDNLKILDLTEISTMKEHFIRNQNHGSIGS